MILTDRNIDRNDGTLSSFFGQQQGGHAMPHAIIINEIIIELHFPQLCGISRFSI